MRKKFKILLPDGTKYKPPEEHMVVMNSKGIFFLYCMQTYYPYMERLFDVIGKYDVVWNDDKEI